MSRSFVMPEELAEVIAAHKAMFGGFTMEATGEGAESAPGDPGGEGEQEPAWLAGRLARERAKYADYDELKAKAARLDEIEQASKTELEKAVARAEQAEQERVQAFADALRWRVAAKHGISDEDAELFLTATDEETLTKQAERLAGKQVKKPDTYVSGQGNNPRPAGDGDPRRQMLREMGLQQST